MTNFELSPNFQEILKASRDYSVENKFSEIPIDVIMLKILEKLVDIDLIQSDLDTLKIRSEIWNQTTVETAIEYCNESLDENRKVYKTKLPVLYQPKKVTLDYTSEQAFERAQEEISGILNRQEIEISDFLLAVSFENGTSKLIDTLVELRILDAVQFINVFRKDLIKNIVSSESSSFGKVSSDSRDDNDSEEGSFEGFRQREEEDREFEEAGRSEGIRGKKANPKSRTPYLDEFSFDMTKAAKEDRFDPVVGREKEIQQVIEIISCRKKNNAILLGDPGCGKTAVIECLAKLIVDKNVPRQIMNKRICSLDLNALVAGTKFRGEYEERLQGIILEVCDNPDIIVYIDEFHNLVGNGSSSGSGDGANILKPYLARGEFQCIGSTTIDEYRKFIERDGALKRRFQNVNIQEPDVELTLEILKNTSTYYENYHRVKYSDEVLALSVDWSGRYIVDRNFPDKALDVLDMAGALAKLKITTKNVALEEAERELDLVLSEKKEAVRAQEFEKASAFKKREDKLLKKIEKLGDDEKNIDTGKWPCVTLDHVAEVITKISGVPVDKIRQSDFEKLRLMKESLESKVIGQDRAVQVITTGIQRNLLGLRDNKKPIASLLMVGPTGTGKSLICKEVAKEFYGSEKALIKFDMAEFSERHDITKLTGATAAYVGYDDTPLLDQIRRKPYSVVLFDEIEKAAPEIYNMFLSLLDEGYVTLGNGVRVDFTNCIIVFTGNIGTKELQLKGSGLGYSKPIDMEDIRKTSETVVMKAVQKEFRPEFINRLSDIVVFNGLGKTELTSIFTLELAKLQSRLSEKGYTLNVSDALRDKIVEECDLKYGARDLQRGIVKNVEDKICEAMLNVKSMQKIISISAKLDKQGEVKVTFGRAKKIVEIPQEV